MRNKEKKYGNLAAILGGITALSGEAIQIATIKGVLDYNWITGHLSDFGIVPVVMGNVMSYSTRIKNKFIRNALPFTWPGICTLHEYFPITIENVYDPQDIALYWLSAGITYAGVKLASSENLRDTINQITP